MQLPDSWVDALFARLQVRYGAAWTRMWEGLDITAVKADWSEELGGYANAPEAIKHALAHLPPDRPPTVGQFLVLCQRVPEVDLPKLPPPKATDAVVEAAIAKARRAISANDPKAWAHRLRVGEQNCERLTAAQRAMWREALKDEFTQQDEAA